MQRASPMICLERPSTLVVVQLFETAWPTVMETALSALSPGSSVLPAELPVAVQPSARPAEAKAATKRLPRKRGWLMREELELSMLRSEAGGVPRMQRLDSPGK